MIEGSNTIFRNFTEVVNHMERDDNHVYQFMLNELGTAGSRDGHVHASRVEFSKETEESNSQLRECIYQVCTMQCSRYSFHQTRQNYSTEASGLWCNTRPVKL